MNTTPTNKKSKKKRNIIIIVILIIIIALVVIKKNQENGISRTKVSVEKVGRKNITESISATGKVQPEKEVLIAPDASGEIIGLYVKEGDSVRKGQLLLKINPDIYLSSLDKVKANLNSSKSNLATSKARLTQSESQLLKIQSDYKRSEKLHNEQVVSDADFEAAKSQYDVAKAEVLAAQQNVEAAKFSINNAEAALKEANDNLTKTAVFAPIDGTVSQLSKEVGERVSGASQFSGGTEVMRIANLNNMEVQVDVSENDIVRVKTGDTSLIEVDAYLGRKFKGIVTQIANSASSGSSQVTNFVVKIRILQDSYKDLLDPKKPNLSPFRPGMSASVDIITSYAKNVLSVPIQAVTTRTDTTAYKKNKETLKDTTSKDVSSSDTKEYVFVYKDGVAELREVKGGIQNTDYYEILSGLKEGESVIIAPYQAVSKLLKNKQPVEPVEKDKLFVSEK